MAAVGASAGVQSRRDDASSHTESCDCVVIGAGVSGLAAAAAIRRTGARVIVLEARDRVGGRLHTCRPAGWPEGTAVDLGGAWIHGATKKNPITRLASGLARVRTEWTPPVAGGALSREEWERACRHKELTEGARDVELSGKRGKSRRAAPDEPLWTGLAKAVERRHPGFLAGLTPRELSLLRYCWGIEAQADYAGWLGGDDDDEVDDDDGVGGGCGANAKDSSGHGISGGGNIGAARAGSNAGPAAATSSKAESERDGATPGLPPPEQRRPLSYLHFDDDDEFDGPDELVVGGMDQVLCRPELDAGHADVLLGKRVTRVETVNEWGAGGVVVRTADGAAYAAAACVCTLPLGVLKSAVSCPAFAPPLPDWKREAIGHLQMGLLNKVVLEYDEAWWPPDSPVFFNVSAAFPLLVNMVPVVGRPVVVALMSSSHAWAAEAWPDGVVAARCAEALAGCLAPPAKGGDAEGGGGEAAVAGAQVAGGGGVTGGDGGVKTADTSARPKQQQDASDGGTTPPPGPPQGSSPPHPPPPVRVTVTRWGSDPLSLGSYAHVPVGASRADCAALGRAMGPVLFAGEATSDHIGTLHGAFLSGQRAAREYARLFGKA